MANTDRKTGIQGDQIQDGTIRPREFDTVDQTVPQNPTDSYILSWNELENKMDWINPDNIGEDRISFGAGRNSSSSTNVYLRRYDGTPMNLAQFVVPYNMTIVAISATVDTINNAWTAQIRKNLSSSPIASLSLSNSELSKYDNTINIDIDAGDKLSIYVLGNNIRRPSVNVFLKKR